MNYQEAIKYIGSTDTYYKIYNDIEICIFDILNKYNLTKGAEDTHEFLDFICNVVLNNIGESWYRQSLGKR